MTSERSANTDDDPKGNEATPSRQDHGNGRKNLPTLATVAARAGVSIGTVSKALNGRGQLRQETRDRVLMAVEQVGFRPNALAQGLSSGRTCTVGILTSDSFGRFTIPVMLGIEDALGAGQISTLLCDGRGDPLREQHYVKTLLSRRVDGIVVTGRRRDRRPSIGDLSTPVVYVLGESENPDDLSMNYDDAQGARLAVTHLLRTGRARIAHVTGPQTHVSARLREQSARETLAREGLNFVTGEALWGDWSEAWGRDAAQILEHSGEPFDAVFCGSDQIARGMTDSFRETGRRVPDDVAIIGFDNWDVMVEASRPTLTTIDPDLTALGRAAARSLYDGIETGELDHGLRELPCRLVIRQSTAASS